MDAIKSFFVGEYKVESPIEPTTSLRDDLWLDDLALEDLATHLRNSFPGLSLTTAQMDAAKSIGDLLRIVEPHAGAAVPSANVKKELAPLPTPPLPKIDPEVLKATFPTVIDRFKTKRQLEPNAIPMIGFYHAGGLVANMRPFSKELDEVTGGVAVNPLWVELPGHGVRSKEKLTANVYDTAPKIAETVAAGILGGDRSKPFFLFAHSVGTLHAFEVGRELEKLGFQARAVVLLSRQAPQIPMDKPEDNFHRGVTDEQFVKKMSAEYAQQTLLDLWKSNPQIVLATLPVSRNDMELLTEYRIRDPDRLLRAPIICAVGTKDRPSNNEQSVRAWRDVSSNNHFVFKLFQGGGHFFYSDNYKDFMKWMWPEVAPLLK